MTNIDVNVKFIHSQIKHPYGIIIGDLKQHTATLKISL